MALVLEFIMKDKDLHILNIGLYDSSTMVADDLVIKGVVFLTLPSGMFKWVNPLVTWSFFLQMWMIDTKCIHLMILKPTYSTKLMCIVS